MVKKKLRIFSEKWLILEIKYALVSAQVVNLVLIFEQKIHTTLNTSNALLLELFLSFFIQSHGNELALFDS